jgi:iron complex transport system substrate-binding protein
MKIKKLSALMMAAVMMFGVWGCGEADAQKTAPAETVEATVQAQEETPAAETTESVSEAAPEAVAEGPVVVTDMIGREVEAIPGSYERVVCIGAGALRMYTYVGDVNLLCGVEDIDNTTLEERPKMFDSVARPYVLAYGDTFNTLASCGVGGPNAQAAEAEKILSCNPDIVISEYEDEAKEDALQEQLGVPVITLKSGPKGVFDDSFDGSMMLLGTIFGTTDKAEKLIAFVY